MAEAAQCPTSEWNAICGGRRLRDTTRWWGCMDLIEDVRCALVAAGLSERGFMTGGFVVEEVDQATVAVAWHVPPGDASSAPALTGLSRCSRALQRAGLHGMLTGRDDSLRVICRRSRVM